jgi:hypothetical protein
MKQHHLLVGALHLIIEMMMMMMMMMMMAILVVVLVVVEVMIMIPTNLYPAAITFILDVIYR